MDDLNRSLDELKMPLAPGFFRINWLRSLRSSLTYLTVPWTWTFLKQQKSVIRCPLPKQVFCLIFKRWMVPAHVFFGGHGRPAHEKVKVARVSKLRMMPKIQNFFGYYPVLAPWLLLEELFSSPSWVFVTEFHFAGLSKWMRWDS